METSWTKSQIGVGIVSGAELQNHWIFFDETWYIYQAVPELVPFAIWGFLEKIYFFCFHGYKLDLVSNGGRCRFRSKSRKPFNIF